MAVKVELAPGEFANVSVDGLRGLHQGDTVKVVGECEGFLIVDHDGILAAMKPEELEPLAVAK